MALIGKIREKSGVAVGFIAVGLLLFMLGADLLQSNSFLLGKSSTRIGSIAGKDIDAKEFNAKLDEAKNNYAMQSGKAPTEYELQSIREQVWNQFVFDYAYKKEFEKLGLAVTEEELVDMVQGKNIHPAIRQSFTNPQTGQFDKSNVITFLQNVSRPTQDPREQQQKAMWYNFEKGLGPDRLRSKYENLVKLSAYVTKEEQIRAYKSQADKASIQFVNVPFASIADSTIKVEDSELKTYLEENKEKYKIEDYVSIDYVTFAIKPSRKDTAYYNEEISSLRTEFAQTKDDSNFVKLNSDESNDLSFVNKSSLPEKLKSLSILKDTVYGPYLENGNLKLYKVFSIKDDTAYSIRASHILFKINPADKAASQAEAKRVLGEIKRGASFEAMASQYGTDGTASQGGDLGWFAEGRMVKPFNDAAFKASKTGLLPDLVESEFGYHIVKITEPKTKVKYGLAAITRKIAPRDETRDSMFTKAGYFASQNKTIEDFTKSLDSNKEGLTKMSAEKVTKSSRYINNLTNAGELIRWAFTDAEVGKTSPVYTIDNTFVVAALKKKRTKGYASVEDVKDELTQKVRDGLKAKQIVEKLSASKGTLEEIATKYGSGVQVNSAADLTPSTGYINGLGYDPYVTGRIFGLKEGSTSPAFQHESGVCIIKAEKITPATEIAEYAQYKNQLLQGQTSRAEYTVNEIIKEASDIEDNRYKFF